MRAAKDQAKERQSAFSVGDVDRLQDEMAVLSDDMKAINESLAQAHEITDDAALEAEYAKLARETEIRPPVATLAGRAPLPIARTGPHYGATAPPRALRAV